MMGPPGKEGLLIEAKPKTYAPPFMMLGFNLENRTSSDFRVQMAARYLAFDVLGSGSELRIDGVIGSDPSVGFSLYRPIFGTRTFVRPYAAATSGTLDFIQDDRIVGQYSVQQQYMGGDVGVSLSHEAGRALNNILESSTKSSEMGKEIAAATREQAAGSETVTKSVDRLQELAVDRFGFVLHPQHARHRGAVDIGVEQPCADAVGRQS